MGLALHGRTEGAREKRFFGGADFRKLFGDDAMRTIVFDQGSAVRCGVPLGHEAFAVERPSDVFAPLLAGQFRRLGANPLPKNAIV